MRRGWGPLKVLVSAQKAIPKRTIFFLARGHWSALQANQWFLSKSKRKSNCVVDQTWDEWPGVARVRGQHGGNGGEWPFLDVGSDVAHVRRSEWVESTVHGLVVVADVGLWGWPRLMNGRCRGRICRTRPVGGRTVFRSGRRHCKGCSILFPTPILLLFP